MNKRKKPSPLNKYRLPEWLLRVVRAEAAQGLPLYAQVLTQPWTTQDAINEVLEDLGMRVLDRVYADVRLTIRLEHLLQDPVFLEDAFQAQLPR